MMFYVLIIGGPAVLLIALIYGRKTRNPKTGTQAFKKSLLAGISERAENTFTIKIDSFLNSPIGIVIGGIILSVLFGLSLVIFKKVFTTILMGGYSGR